MTWLTLILKTLGIRGVIAVLLGIALLGTAVAYKVQAKRLDSVSLALTTEQAKAKSLARQLGEAISANGEWQSAALQLSADIARMHKERDELAAANKEAVKRARAASQLYVKPGAPSTTCAVALKALDKACPELKGY